MAKAYIVTRESLALKAPRRWCEQYRNPTGDKLAILHALEALEASGSLTPDAVDLVIGNRSWTKTGWCDGCDAVDNGPRVVVGEPLDYDSRTATLCRACAAEAAAAFGP